jgi:hypothetical protein
MSEIRGPAKDLRAALGGCGLLLLAAWGGAWWDEATRSGWSTWVSLCRNGTPDPLTVLSLYTRLLPGSMLGLLGGGLLLLLAAAAAPRPGLARGRLAGHAACLLAMPASIYGCALAAGTIASSRGAQFATMALVDLGLALALVPVALWLLRPGRPARHAQGGVTIPSASTSTT